jgi:hypothetical protein
VLSSGEERLEEITDRVSDFSDRVREAGKKSQSATETHGDEKRLTYTGICD